MVMGPVFHRFLIFGQYSSFALLFVDEKMIEHTQELSSILTGLTASTSYNIEVRMYR